MFNDQALEAHLLLPSQQASPSDQVVSGDVEALWEESISKKLDQAEHDSLVLSWGQTCIYRIPTYLGVWMDKSSYIPIIVSIGPYHHGQENVKEMEQHKWRAIKQILKRTSQDINLYLDAMRALEERSRACYTGSINLTSNEFVEMMVLDGCFILEIMRGYITRFTDLNYTEHDPIFSDNSNIMRSTFIEMLMLENQIPLFVLDKLLELQTDWPTQWRSISMVALICFEGIVGIPLQNHEGVQAGLHFLDLIRQTLVIFSRQLEEVDMDTTIIPSVTNLMNAGVDFKVKTTNRYLDITFENGVIHMPEIMIHDFTKTVFFNLMSFEQCHVSIPRTSCTVTDYLIFMDMLIDSVNDLSYLRSCGIIQHICASDVDAVNNLDSITKGVCYNIDSCYHAPVCRKVNAYYNQKWNVWRATLKKQYFNNPWTIISFIAALFLILLTVGQTFYSIYAYYKPSS